MTWTEFVYPSYETALVEAYGGRFEAVFIVLHPFIRVPDFLSWHVTRKYPDDEAIASLGARCSWAEVLPHVGMSSCAELNRALLSSIGALPQDLRDPEGVNRMQKYLEANAVWMPAEGRFEPLLRPDFLKVFELDGKQELVFVPEFPESEPVVRLSLKNLRHESVPFPTCGTIARLMLHSCSRWTGTASSRCSTAGGSFSPRPRAR